MQIGTFEGSLNINNGFTFSLDLVCRIRQINFIILIRKQVFSTSTDASECIGQSISLVRKVG